MIDELWLQIRYANLLGPFLERYKVQKNQPFLASCRCPFCHDSQKKANKKRGYIFQDTKNAGLHLMYFCHNCSASFGFAAFLEQINPLLYREYKFERFRASAPVQPVKAWPKSDYHIDITKIGTKRFQKAPALKAIPSVSQLPQNHKARLYVQSRKIPPESHYRLFYAPKFFKWTNQFTDENFDLEKIKDEPRLILPMIDQTGYLFGYQGRSFAENAQLRYITILMDKSRPKVFGLDKLDPSKPVYVVEGPIDSLFLPNALAAAGSDLTSIDIPNRILIFDNEPRNKQIIKKMENAVDKGESIVVWSSSPDKKQDINDLIKAGRTPEQVMDEIRQNTFQGLKAKLRIKDWKRL